MIPTSRSDMTGELCREEEQLPFCTDLPSAASCGPAAWPDRKKWLHVIMAAFMTLASPLASSVLAPALPQLAQDFGLDLESVSLVIPIYLFGLASGPLVWTPFARVHGRRQAFNCSNVLLLSSHLGCILAPSFPWLVTCRFLAGCAGGCAITQGSGVVIDLMEKEQSGKAVAILGFVTVWSPVLSPALGGSIAQATSWRWCLCVPFTVVALNTMISFAFFEETMKRKEGRVIKILRDTFRGQTKVVVLAPVVITTVLSTIFYAVQVFLYVDVPTTYAETYAFTPSQTGCAFLAVGFGMTLGLLGFGLASDRIMLRLAGNRPREPKFRLPPMVISAALVGNGLFIYSHTTQPTIPWMISIIATFFVGAGLYSTSVIARTYVMDMYPEYAVETGTLMVLLRFSTGPLASRLSEMIAVEVGRAGVQRFWAVLALQAIPVICFLYWKDWKTSEV